jgi:HNH endonuclease
MDKMPNLPRYCHFNYSRGRRFIRFRRGDFTTYLSGEPSSEEFKRQYTLALKGIKQKRKRIIDDFWNYVNRTTSEECWQWMKHIDGEGYGRALPRNKKHSVLAHRSAWLLVNGRIPKGLHVLHRCDNPACCNPSHLFLGTHQDNMRDRNKKRRFHSVLSYDDITIIRKLRQSGFGPTEIGRKFGISQSHVSHICAGDIWKT